MYKRLMTAMESKGVTQRMISEAIGVHYNTVLRKISGESDFEVQEAQKIYRIWFREYDFAQLFAVDNELESA